ncbi:MAG: S-layer homology domain-containing protein [Bacillota bacterium]|nr:S-layer homology domain-containing protein [Bacillota bacterium]
MKRREWKKQLALMLCLVMIISILNPFFVLAEEAGPYDELATENIERLYAAYLDSEGVLYKTSFEGIDPYHMFILKEAGVDVANWSYNDLTLRSKLRNLIDETKTNESMDPINAKAVAYQYIAAVALEENILAEELLKILLQRHAANEDGTFFNGAYNQWTNLPVFDVLAKTGAISDVDLDKSAQYLLELQTDNGSFGDFMSTTQAMRALAGLKKNIPDEALNTDMETAIQQAVDWVKTTIQEDGSFFETSWDDPITNTAEVILTLAVLKKDLNEWKHGTTGKGPTDYLATIDSFGSQNAGSNVWALEAYLLLGAKPDTTIGTPDPIIGDDEEVTIRIEGAAYTILPETVVEVIGGTGYADILIDNADALGYSVEYTEFGSDKFIDFINGIPGEPYWMVQPWQGGGYHDGDRFVLSGNGSTNEGSLSLSSKSVLTGQDIQVSVTLPENTPVEGATVIYYQEANRTSPVTAGITDSNGELSFSISGAGSYYIAADKANTAAWPDPDNGLVRTLAKQVEVNDEEVTIRIEGSAYTILPETVVEVIGGTGYADILIDNADALGYSVEYTEFGSDKFIDFINGIPGEPYWMVAPWQGGGYYDGDRFVLSGNGSTNEGSLSLSSKSVLTGQDIQVSVTLPENTPVEGATVIYYQEANRTSPATAGITDSNGELSFSISGAGSYYIAADKANTAAWPDPDNGLVRTLAKQVEVSAGSSGGGGSGPAGITVYTTVTGKNGQNYYSGYMTLTSSDLHGMTPVGALHKTGLTYDYDSLNFIHTINGLSNEGLNGWMYRVNGVVPPVSATSYTLRADDRLEWFYSTDSANLVGGAGTGLVGAAGTFTADLKKIREEAADWIISQTVFDVYDSFNDWDAFALVRTGREVPDSYLETLNQYVTDQQGSFRLVTDYARTILALSALGKDAGSVSGYHLLDSLINHERMLAQGINGPAYTLLALDAIDYMIPDDARWNRESLLEWMLDQQKRDGGFSLDQNPAAFSDVDITAVVLQAFSRYQDDAEVKEATEKAVKWLINQPMNSTESVAQTIIALSVLQLDLMEERFIREENSLLDQLTQYHNTDGGFAHTLGGGSDQLATQQALMALTAYERYLNEAPDLFDLKEIEIEQEEQTAVTEEPVTEIHLADEAHISAWALEWVKKAVAYGLMSGVSAEELRFDPKRELTRAEFAVLMAKIHGAAISSNEASVFQDVQPGSWYFGYVMTARKNGWMSGVAEDAFAPHRSISRQEMAVVLAKALELTAANELAQPADLEEAAEWAKEPVGLVYQHRLMVGDGQRFMPRSVVTREMAAVIMVKLYEDHLMP